MNKSKKQQKIGKKELDEFKLFIIKEANKFSKSSNICDSNDLQQAGFLGLLSAYKNFNPKKGGWKTYAMNCIRNSIQSESIQFLKNLTIPKTAAIHYYKIKKLINSGKPINEICNESSLSESYAHSLIDLININNMETKNNFENIEAVSATDIEFINNIIEVFESLNNEDKTLLELRVKHTFNEMGNILDMSRECVRKKYKNIIKKLINFL